MTERILDQYRIAPELNTMLSLAIQKTAQLPPDLDWARFERLTEKNRIEPLIARGVRKIPDAGRIPALERLCKKQAGYQRIALQQMQQLAAIANRFARQDIPFLSVKGPVLAAEIYGDPSLRYSRDLDLMVPESHFEQACACLGELGFEEEITVLNKTPLRRKLREANGEEMHRVFRKGDICVELHWRLSFRVEESFEAMWAARREKKLLGQTVICPGEKENLSYLISHAAGHGYQRLRWLLDLYELQKKPVVPWQTLYEYMQATDAGPLLIETLLVLFLLPAFEMEPLDLGFIRLERQNGQVRITYPDASAKDVEKGIALAEAVYPILVNETDADGIAGRKYMHLLPTLGKKKTALQAALGVFKPSRADLKLVDLPDQLYFLYYIIRPFHKLWRLAVSVCKKGR